MKPLVVIIANPAAGRASAEEIRHAARFLEGKGCIAEILLTQKRGDAERFAREALLKKPLFIMAAGGDGTINEAVNGMAGSETPLAVLPLGTTNVLARELNISNDISTYPDKALAGDFRTASMGRIEAGGGSRYFSLMAGIGFDGRAVHDMNPSLKNVSGEAAYFLSGLMSLVRYSPDNISLTIEGREYPAHSAIVGKSSRYGGDYRITPDAGLFDPFFYTCIFQGRTRRDLLRYVFGVLRGRHLEYKDVAYLKSDFVEIRGSAHIQIDGDYFGTTPAGISIEKDALKILC